MLSAIVALLLATSSAAPRENVVDLDLGALKPGEREILVPAERPARLEIRGFVPQRAYKITVRHGSQGDSTGRLRNAVRWPDLPPAASPELRAFVAELGAVTEETEANRLLAPDGQADQAESKLRIGDGIGRARMPETQLLNPFEPGDFATFVVERLGSGGEVERTWQGRVVPAPCPKASGGGRASQSGCSTRLPGTWSRPFGMRSDGHRLPIGCA